MNNRTPTLTLTPPSNTPPSNFQFSIGLTQTLSTFFHSKFRVRCSMFDVRCFLVFTGLLFAISSFASDPSSAFDAANNLYYAGKFSDAATAYENILHSGQKSVALYYNLGNAWFKSGQIGKAIAVYREAEKLNPRDPDIRANLQFARNQIQGPTLAPSRGQRLLGKLTLNEWTTLAAAALWLCFAILALREWKPSLKRPLRLYLFAVAVATILLFACVAISWSENRFTRTAIVTMRDVSVRKGPLDESDTSFNV